MAGVFLSLVRLAAPSTAPAAAPQLVVLMDGDVAVESWPMVKHARPSVRESMLVVWGVDSMPLKPAMVAERAAWRRMARWERPAR